MYVNVHMHVRICASMTQCVYPCVLCLWHHGWIKTFHFMQWYDMILYIIHTHIIYIYIYIYIYTHTHTHTYKCVTNQFFTMAHVYSKLYTHTHARTHARTHAHTFKPKLPIILAKHILRTIKNTIHRSNSLRLLQVWSSAASDQRGRTSSCPWGYWRRHRAGDTAARRPSPPWPGWSRAGRRCDSRSCSTRASSPPAGRSCADSPPSPSHAPGGWWCGCNTHVHTEG